MAVNKTYNLFEYELGAAMELSDAINDLDRLSIKYGFHNDPEVMAIVRKINNAKRGYHACIANRIKRIKELAEELANIKKKKKWFSRKD